MQRSSDPLEGDLKTRAQAVSAVAAKHATAVDSGARFPRESFAAVKAQRLLGIMVPTKFGGEGADLAQVADVCFQLAQGCSSTGMIYAMHQIKTACIVRHMRESAALENVLRRLCSEQLLLASSTTEGQGGGNVRSSEAPIEHQDGRITLERRASVISYGAYADAIVTTARRAADAAATDQVLVAFFKEDYTLTPLQGWNTLGMRGTCSEGYSLKASGTPDQVIPDPYEMIHPQTMVPTAHLLWGSVWAGIAASATARAQGFIRNVVRQSGGQMPPGAPQYTRALASLRTLRGMLASSLRNYQRVMNDPKALASLEFQTMITLTKVEASELAVAIVNTALRTCGLSGYRCDSEFSIERHLRDVLSAPIMINNDRILANLANSSLLAPVAGSLSD
ncbi:MAG TPA: acyl-CoA dehydrogenase family protein [Steroidobacteraceae bacterium]|jgi:acyl-CoA dehydrogenase|nr:acyl-CoA dehydrogenase family protein [Steroidobacteraceae bacterium]